MLAISVEFLTGRYVATAHHDRRSAEWPPHPARLFSALVATWADQDPPDSAERAVLAALEAAGPPCISAPPATTRSAVTHYVPVNDASVIAPAWYQRRALSLVEKLGQLDAALDAAGGDLSDRAVQRALAQVDKERDATQKVNAVGTTPVSSALALLPEGRGRQPREFPSVTPDDPTVVFEWADLVLDDGASTVLDTLLARMTRLGHSSSLVSCRVLDTAPEPTWIPARDGDTTLRWVRRGQLDALEAAFSRHLGSKPRTLPARGVTYRRSGEGAVLRPARARPTLSGDWFVFEFLPGSRMLPVTRAVDITRALRGAVLAHLDDPDEAITGHRADTRPTDRAHVAFVALPFVGHSHASGRLLGAAILLPTQDALGASAASVRRSILRALGSWRASDDELELRLGRAGLVRGRLVPSGGTVLQTLARVTWSRAAREWVSVTPVALPKHPGPLARGSQARRQRAYARAEEQIRHACEHAGLPEPDDVAVTRQPLLAGARPAGDFPAFRQMDHRQRKPTPRLLVHVALRFAEAIEGPVVLGSGRYFGLGLMRPLIEGVDT